MTLHDSYTTVNLSKVENASFAGSLLVPWKRKMAADWRKKHTQLKMPSQDQVDSVNLSFAILKLDNREFQNLFAFYLLGKEV